VENQKIKYVYIASPYSKGDPAVNVRESFVIADDLLECGFVPYPPLYTHFWHIISPKPYHKWVRLDLEWIKKCDCILRLPGISNGADGEVEFAKKIGKPVFYSIEEIVEYNKLI